MYIYPSIDTDDKTVFDIRVLELIGIAPIIHVDFCDGKFFDFKSTDFEYIRSYFNKVNIKIQIHFMAYKPSQFILLKEMNIESIVIHYESLIDIKKELEILRSYPFNFKVGIAFNNIDSMRRIDKKYYDFIHILSTSTPGVSGGKLRDDLESIIEKIISNGVKDIEIDGGLSIETIEKIKDKYGIEKYVLGHEIWNSQYPVNKFIAIKDMFKF